MWQGEAVACETAVAVAAAFSLSESIVAMWLFVEELLGRDAHLGAS